ncbi:MAG: tetratricopeptide repeat protein, partial [Acidobacteriota bacterium]
SGGFVLELLHTDKTSFSRVQWTDPKTSSTAVRQISRDRTSVQIGSLLPGELELTFFDEANRSRPLKVTLQQGRNTVDITRQLTGSLRRPRGVAYQTASLAAPTLQAQPPARLAPAAAEATLALRLQQGTDVYVDGSFFGSSGPAGRILQLQGLSAGVHTVRLVPSPEREQRFRVKLFSGPQILETTSGELRPVLQIKPPPEQVPPPTNLPPVATDLYRRFERALWEGRLLAPAGDSAWDLYQQLARAVPAALNERLRTRLVVALGDRAQLTILKYLRGGDVRWNAAEFEEGAALLARVQQLLPSNRSFDSQQRFFVGRALIERGQYAQAAPELQRAVSLDPDASYSHNALALALWKQNLLDQAIVPLRQAIELSPAWTYPRNTLALIYLEQRRYTEAEREFDSSLQVHAEDSTGHHGIAQVYFLTGRWQQAEESLRRALEFSPGNAYAYETLGRLYQRLQRAADAENAFRLAIRLEPDEPSFHLSLADLLRQGGRLQQARPIIARLQSDHPDHPQILVGDAILLAAEGKPAEAEASFARALRLAPLDSNLRVQYGLFLQQRGSADQAMREFKEALRISPVNAFAHYNLAVIHLSQQKISDADKELEQALRSDPRLAAPRLLLGKIRAAQTRHREALEQFRQALPLSFEPAQRQEIEEAATASERAVVGQRVEQARTRVERKDYGRAWSLYAEVLKDAPDSIDVRDAVFDLRAQWLEAPVAELPSSRLAAALQTDFWKTQAQAEILWKQGGKDAAFRAFLGAVENLQPSEWKIIAASSLNYRNRNYSVHEWIYRWGRRLIEERRYDAVLQLMEAAVGHKLFAPVPGLVPVTVDNLMVPADVADPKQFSDFEVEHHPDPRAHELYALAWAGRGDMERARIYLAALQGTPHAARIQRELERIASEKK